VDNPVENLWITLWIRLWKTRRRSGLWKTGGVFPSFSTTTLNFSTDFSTARTASLTAFFPLFHSFHSPYYYDDSLYIFRQRSS